MKKTIITTLIVVSLIIIYFLNLDNKETKEEEIIKEEVCKSNCKIGDKIVLNDNSSWHILNIDNNIITLFSDATIDLEGNYLPLREGSMRNTGVPVAFDTQNTRTTEKNPYCIFQDLGCSAYEKNNIDVFEDSNIKKIIDNNFLPKITKTLNSENIKVRLMQKHEFDYFKNLEYINNTRYNWLYYSGYWLMTPYNSHSLYVHREKEENLTLISAYIHYGYGIRPVIEVDYDLIFD